MGDQDAGERYQGSGDVDEVEPALSDSLPLTHTARNTSAPHSDSCSIFFWYSTCKPSAADLTSIPSTAEPLIVANINHYYPIFRFLALDSIPASDCFLHSMLFYLPNPTSCFCAPSEVHDPPFFLPMHTYFVLYRYYSRAVSCLAISKGWILCTGSAGIELSRVLKPVDVMNQVEFETTARLPSVLLLAPYLLQ
jgi:hypothetical protein